MADVRCSALKGEWLGFLAVGAAIAALPVTACAYVVFHGPIDAANNAAFLAAHPLLQHLPPSDAAAGIEMRSRLLAKYGIGTSAKPMRSDLASQGFRFVASVKGPHSFVAALKRPGNLDCLAYRKWFVLWQEDEDGRLLSLDARHVELMS